MCKQASSLHQVITFTITILTIITIITIIFQSISAADSVVLISRFRILACRNRNSLAMTHPPSKKIAHCITPCCSLPPIIQSQRDQKTSVLPSAAYDARRPANPPRYEMHALPVSSVKSASPPNLPLECLLNRRGVSHLRCDQIHLCD